MTIFSFSKINLLSVLGLAVFTLLLQLRAEPARFEEGLVLHLPLVQDLKDHSPAKHPIEIVGTVRIEAEGAYFSGRKDWLEAPHVPLNERPFAIALWIKPTAPDRHIGFLEQFDLDRPGHHFHLHLRENRQPYFGFYGRDQISPLSVGWEVQWMHLVFQYTGEFQQIWINGRLITSLRTPPYQGDSGITAIGKTPRWSNVKSKDFAGYMRDLRIYQRTLEREEIASLCIPPNFARLETNTVQTGNQINDPAAPSGWNASLLAILSEDTSRPFLEIDENRITINGRAGKTYLLQSTTDFKAWTLLKRFVSETGRVIYIEEQDSPMRFYRVLIESREP